MGLLYGQLPGEEIHIEMPPEAFFIIETLEKHGYEAYVVGGCVRDALLGVSPGDWDITTSARPEEVKACFGRTIDTGIKHGTVTVLVHGTGYEVTTYRVDGAYSDGRHPDRVTFTPELKEDLRRRDFTVNAMAYRDRDGLVDLFGGREDLREGVIRCVGNPSERFGEDALRVMRAVRFAAKLGFSIEKATREAMAAHAGELRRVSAERIRDELMKTVLSPHPSCFRLFHELGITAVVLPEFDACMEVPRPSPYRGTDSVGGHLLRAMCCVPPDPVLRLAMLLHEIGAPAAGSTGQGSPAVADSILRRLRFDNETRKRTVNLVRHHALKPAPLAPEVRRAIVEVGQDSFGAYLAVQEADNAAGDCSEEEAARIRAVRAVYGKILADGDCLGLGGLAVNGDDLMALGIRGKQVGEVLRGLLSEVLADPSRNRRELLLAAAREGIAGHGA